MSNYITVTEETGRGGLLVQRERVNLKLFADDLANALNITSASATVTEYGDEAKIQIGESTELRLSTDRYARTPRVEVSIRATDISHDDRNWHAQDHKTPSASVSVGRDIKKIAADIKRRVIEASQSALQLQHDYAAQQQQNRHGIIAKAAKLQKAFPEIQVTVHEREQRASLYLNRDNLYVSGSLQHDGRVNIERIGSLDQERFARVMSALLDK
jgi:hypothetical protein